MRVSVSLCAVLRDFREADECRSTSLEVEVDDDATLDDAIRTLRLPPGVESVACVNGRPAPGATPLAEGDHLYIFNPVSGG